MSDEELEFQKFIHEGIDYMVDHLCDQIDNEYSDDDYKVSDWDRSQAKFFLKQIAPGQSPTVAFIVAQVLRALLMWAHEQRAIHNATENPEKVDQMINEIVESETGQNVLKKLEERQKTNAAKYKSVTKGDKTMKVADLGDLMSDASLN